MGIDIRDLWRGELSWRRLYVIVQNLPPNSAFLVAISGDERNRVWGLNEHLLALLFDAIQNNTIASLAPHSKKNLPHPEPLPRPGIGGKKKVKTMRVADMPGAVKLREARDRDD